MRISSSTYLLHALSLAALLGWWGCTATAPASRSVSEGPDRFVRLEVTSRASEQEHSHPATISSAELAKRLSKITITSRTVTPQGTLDLSARPPRADGAPAFPDDMIAWLSTNVSQALQKATSLEEVVFFVDRPRDQSIREITSGGFYVKGDALHFLLANYRHATIGPEEIKEARADPLKVLGQTAYDFGPGPFGRVRATKGFKAFAIGAPQHIVFDDSARMGSPRKQDAEPRPPHRDQKSSHGEGLAAKLRELQQLRQDGLISEEEYGRMRKKLLETF